MKRRTSSFRKRYNRVFLVGLLSSFFSLVSIFSVGFSSWIISGNEAASATLNISAAEVELNGHEKASFIDYDNTTVSPIKYGSSSNTILSTSVDIDIAFLTDELDTFITTSSDYYLIFLLQSNVFTDTQTYTGSLRTSNSSLSLDADVSFNSTTNTVTSKVSMQESNSPSLTDIVNYSYNVLEANPIFTLNFGSLGSVPDEGISLSYFIYTEAIV